MQIKQAGLTLPSLLLLDRRCLGENPYEFCRWCRTSYPEVKLILTHSTQREISPPERDWTIQQGAADLLPGFPRDNMVSSATAGIKRVLETLGEPQLNEGALIAVLLKLRRELELRQEKRDRRLIDETLDGSETERSIGAEYNSNEMIGTDFELDVSNPAVSNRKQAIASSSNRSNGSTSTTSTQPQSPKPRLRYRGIRY